MVDLGADKEDYRYNKLSRYLCLDMVDLRELDLDWYTGDIEPMDINRRLGHNSSMNLWYKNQHTFVACGPQLAEQGDQGDQSVQPP